MFQVINTTPAHHKNMELHYSREHGSATLILGVYTIEHDGLLKFWTWLEQVEKFRGRI